MKFLTGFFMAWGNFLALPCPLKKWDDDLKNYMLGFLPAVGLLIGLLWDVMLLLVFYLTAEPLLIAFFATLTPFLLCGFLHLDGFMDCCDAILSRRSLPERQAILKDAHTGAFAVISLCFLLLGDFCFFATAVKIGITPFQLIAIPVVSRAVSAAMVLTQRPMETSQYAHGEGATATGQKKTALMLLLLQVVLFVVLPPCLAHTFFDATGLLPILRTAGITALCGLLAAWYGKKQLGGMNGDIAGFSICWAEAAGICSLLL